MAIRTREEEVTRQDRRMKCQAKETGNRLVRQAKKRDRVTRKLLKELGIEITHETLDRFADKAFIEVLELTKRERTEASVNRQLRELRADGRRYIQLAHVVTNYIDKEWKGFMWGDSLPDLYEEIGEAVSESADDIEIAVDIAVGKKLLRRKDEHDTSSHEWVCVDLIAAA